MKTNSRIKQLSNWYKLARPNKGLAAISFISACIPAICYVLSPIFVANVVTSITEQNYNGAIMWLAIDFVQLFVRQVAWHINYWNFERIIDNVYTNISMNIYNKIIASNDKNFKTTSKEKIINIISGDIYTVAEFTDHLTTKLSYFLRAIVTIVIVFTSSPLAGAIIIAISKIILCLYVEKSFPIDTPPLFYIFLLTI